MFQHACAVNVISGQVEPVKFTNLARQVTDVSQVIGIEIQFPQAGQFRKPSYQSYQITGQVQRLQVYQRGKKRTINMSQLVVFHIQSSEVDQGVKDPEWKGLKVIVANVQSQ